ncbi:MAG: hypothetical protein U0359_03430 [Byssovorax sp.]
MISPPSRPAPRLGALLLSALLGACGSPRSQGTAESASPSASAPPPASASAPAPAASSASAPAASAAASPPAPTEGKDFAEEVAMLYRVAACGNDGPLPEGIDAAIVKAHCDEILPKIETYKKRFIGVAQPFLKDLQPAGLPDPVVYPFGGGDLVTALTTYGDAKDITTISLELAGDPRRIRKMGKNSLTRSLRQLRMELGELIFLDFSNSDTLKKTQRGDIPGEIGLFLVGLAMHGMEPVNLRYFNLTPEGDIHYLSEAEIDAVESKIAVHKKDSWTPPDFSEAFSNVEITFRPKGAPAGEPLRVHRHIAENLGNGRLGKDPRLLRYLEKKGHVRAMTKAASYLLWKDAFSQIRDYLLGNMDFMISDSTGIPGALDEERLRRQHLRHLQGRSCSPTRQRTSFIRYWKKRPETDRCPSATGAHRLTAAQNHLMVTHRPAAGSAPAAPSGSASAIGKRAVSPHPPAPPPAR